MLREGTRVTVVGHDGTAIVRFVDGPFDNRPYLVEFRDGIACDMWFSRNKLCPIGRKSVTFSQSCSHAYTR